MTEKAIFYVLFFKSGIKNFKKDILKVNFLRWSMNKISKNNNKKKVRKLTEAEYAAYISSLKEKN